MSVIAYMPLFDVLFVSIDLPLCVALAAHWLTDCNLTHSLASGRGRVVSAAVVGLVALSVVLAAVVADCCTLG